jgi:L-asparaginase
MALSPQRYRPPLDGTVSRFDSEHLKRFEMSASDRPRIAIIGCGGTISSLGTSPLDVMDYPDDGKKLSVEEVIDFVPELSKVAEIVPIVFRSISSSALTVADWMELRNVVRDVCHAQSDIAGVVILHGTGTLEETAFFLHLTTDVEQAIVVVGAQRPLNAIGSDAPINLLNAIRVASHPNSRNRGVLVVLNDEVHSARDVVKSSNYRVHAFRSADYGMLGQMDGDGLHFFRSLDRFHTRTSPFARIDRSSTLPRVDIVYSYVGTDDLFITAATSAGARGLVSAGFAPGLTTPAAKLALERLADDGFPVVLCSRAAAGRVVNRRYVLAKGMIAGEDLSPQKARILLMLCLAQGFDIERTRQAFSTV